MNDNYTKRRFKKAIARTMAALEMDGASDECKASVKSNIWDLHRDIESGEGEAYFNEFNAKGE